MRTLQTETVTLEPQARAHAQSMFAVLADPAIYQHENAPPESLEWLQQRFARLESRHSPDLQEQWLNWVIRFSDGALIGYVQATVRADGSALIAYVLGSAWWGKGLASQAVVAMVDELRTQYGVTQLEAVLKQSNLPSKRLLERLGFALAVAQDGQIDADEIWMRRPV